MSAGYSRRRLVEKLDLKPGSRAHFRRAPEGYLDTLGALPEGVVIRRSLRSRVDFIQAFYDRRRELARELPTLRAALAPDGCLWVSWPKRASGVATDLTGDVVRRSGLGNGLVDVKVRAVDEVWSGLKLVFRKADRARTAAEASAGGETTR